MIISIKVDKRGDINSYINKPVLNEARNWEGLTPEGTVHYSNPIGVITEAIELDDCYELKLTIWDRYATEVREYMDNELSSISISL